MADFANLAKMLGDKSSDGKDESFDEGDDTDDMGSEDSGAQVFNSAAQEAFYAIKEGDIKAFSKALKTAINGTM